MHCWKLNQKHAEYAPYQLQKLLLLTNYILWPCPLLNVLTKMQYFIKDRQLSTSLAPGVHVRNYVQGLLHRDRITAEFHSVNT
jgi:hypothetical protein